MLQTGSMYTLAAKFAHQSNCGAERDVAAFLMVEQPCNHSSVMVAPLLDRRWT